jgi:hypothetical protein
MLYSREGRAVRQIPTRASAKGALPRPRSGRTFEDSQYPHLAALQGRHRRRCGSRHRNLASITIRNIIIAHMTGPSSTSHARTSNSKWQEQHDRAMQELKNAIITSPALIHIDYSSRPVFLSIDSSWRAVGWSPLPTVRRRSASLLAFQVYRPERARTTVLRVEDRTPRPLPHPPRASCSHSRRY